MGYLASYNEADYLDEVGPEPTEGELNAMAEWDSMLQTPEALELAPLSLWQEMEDERAEAAACLAWARRLKAAA